jgi:hypothetical protein
MNAAAYRALPRDPREAAAALGAGDFVARRWDRHGRLARSPLQGNTRDRTVGSRAFATGVYPIQDRFRYDFNERYRAERGRPLLC